MRRHLAGGGATLTNIVRFAASRQVSTATISRQERERLAELPHDIVDRIVALRDIVDGDADAKITGASSRPWLRL